MEGRGQLAVDGLASPELGLMISSHTWQPHVEPVIEYSGIFAHSRLWSRKHFTQYSSLYYVLCNQYRVHCTQDTARCNLQ